MARRPAYNGVYETMDFPLYEFREYPKWISLNDGTKVLAETQRHELELMTDDTSLRAPHPAEAEAASLAKANDEMAAKLAELEEKLAALSAAKPAQKTALEPAPATPAAKVA